MCRARVERKNYSTQTSIHRGRKNNRRVCSYELGIVHRTYVVVLIYLCLAYKIFLKNQILGGKCHNLWSQTIVLEEQYSIYCDCELEIYKSLKKDVQSPSNWYCSSKLGQIKSASASQLNNPVLAGSNADTPLAALNKTLNPLRSIA